jgi:hypothetical protein
MPKYFIEIMIIFRPNPITFQAGNLAGVALASMTDIGERSEIILGYHHV